jgi:hypothetical protein
MRGRAFRDARTTEGLAPDVSDEVLLMWVIYEKPKDHPKDFVARAWAIRRGVPAPVPLAAADDTDRVGAN